MAATTTLKVNLNLEMDEERLREIFDGYEIRFSKAKIKRLKEMIDDIMPDIIEVMEETLEEQIGDLITDEWEK
jgi:hypothetical protein